MGGETTTGVGFFREYGAWLTKKTGHYIDWTRIGERVAESSGFIPSYSKEELQDRGIILLSTVASGLIAYGLRSEKESGFTTAAWTTLGALVGFTVSHAIIILPLIQKRRACEKRCLAINAALQELLLPYLDINIHVQALITAIMALSLTSKQRGNASLTWGKRRGLLEKLLQNTKSIAWDDEGQRQKLSEYCKAAIAAPDLGRFILENTVLDDIPMQTARSLPALH